MPKIESESMVLNLVSKNGNESKWRIVMLYERVTLGESSIDSERVRNDESYS